MTEPRQRGPVRTFSIASWIDRLWRAPKELSKKSASTSGPTMSRSAPWTTRSRVAGIAITRALPPSFRISFGRHGLGRHVPVRRSARSSPEEGLAPARLDPPERLAVGSWGALVALRLHIRRFERVEFHDMDMQPQKRCAGVDFARWPIFARDSCRLIVGFVIPPVPRLVLRMPPAGSLRSTGITPLRRCYGPARQALVFAARRLSARTATLLPRVLSAERGVLPHSHSCRYT